ncbi:SpvB/TcaC N-terminal domain-containing protein [Tunturiibacter lichenicola]|uniref:SpvB/TcaC N-terminal domain-containing protein n=1 Tax=Tunturiibacter lichenicola TaxID=2051959 RepID=UPI003D9AC7D0
MNYPNNSNDTATNQPSRGAFLLAPPQINVPKGGGAIRGMGEKFSANPVTGTGSIVVPIFTSPSRSGFTPQLSLSYDSGAGNGPFGLGWNLSLPSIQRKTDKGLPRYRDNTDSDVFILSGVEDLVPVLDANANWKSLSDGSGRLFGSKQTYSIRKYRPRIDPLFARIERWTNDSDLSDIFWRSISRDNVTTWYGRSANSRIMESGSPYRIFGWLISESYDDKGNVIVYCYQQEDEQRIFENSQGNAVALTNESNRARGSRTANRYLQRILYGNRATNREAKTLQATDPTLLPASTWMFELVFDYGQGRYAEDPPDTKQQIFARAQINPPAGTFWAARQDPFSTYRSCFEVRTYRLCRRALMFHHFPQELGVADYLVRSTEFNYSESPIASFMTGVKQSGHVLQPTANQRNRYLKESLPSLTFEYSQVLDPAQLAQQPVRDVDPQSLENVPGGLDGTRYQWLDLDGEGASGILSEQGGAWFYKRNLSPINGLPGTVSAGVLAKFGAQEVLAKQPALVTAGARQQFLDLAGDGHLDLVDFRGEAPGFYKREDHKGWKPFSPFQVLPVLDWNNPNLKFIDLTGNGHADILISDEQVFRWHASLAEAGFGPEESAPKPMHEDRGPAVLFADGTESIFLADFSGDGLTDVVRVRNGEVCYWPSLGYGRFGRKVQMDNAPWFESPDQFDGRRIRLADVDGSGVTDIIYLDSTGVQVYFNHSGNSWSEKRTLSQFPAVDDLASVHALDLLGVGTACLVWSSPLPGNAQRAMRYIDLMGGQKPHLLTRIRNNLGAETEVRYAPSTKFYLRDKLDGRMPWVTQLPFPVHCVEQVKIRDAVSHNVFVTRYAYHHGYFDGPEREFRGFGMIEQWDTELDASADTSGALNLSKASRVPPILTKTWFHTGAYLEGGKLSRHFEHEYYQEWASGGGSGNFSAAERESMLLPDTLWPTTILLPDKILKGYKPAPEEAREIARGLKGSMLRQEVYGLDGTTAQDRPYLVSEKNFTIEILQPKGMNPHAVVFSHARETVDFHYERELYRVGPYDLADPRVSHDMILCVDAYGNVKQSVAIGYGRRRPSTSTQLTGPDPDNQKRAHVTFTENSYTTPLLDDPDDYRTPLRCESSTYEILKIMPAPTSSNVTSLLKFNTVANVLAPLSDGLTDLLYEGWNMDESTLTGPRRRPIERVRHLYYDNDLSGPKVLGQTDSLGLLYESYKLAFTSSLLNLIYKSRTEKFLPSPASVLGREGGYALGDDFVTTGWFPHSDKPGEWWIPSGQRLYSDLTETPLPAGRPQPLAGDQTSAVTHFFMPMAERDPYGWITRVTYDAYDLLTVAVKDPIGNMVQSQNDYRVLQAAMMTDPNGNQTAFRFDALGLVAGSAVAGNQSRTPTPGDSFKTFNPDLTEQQILDFYADPIGQAAGLLGTATTRVVYDVNAYARWANHAGAATGQVPPSFAATLVRETHVSDLGLNPATKIQINFSYSDGFGREIQKKIPAEVGPVVRNGPSIDPRWVGSGWTIFNNKGKPVQQFEPFFSNTHQFEFAIRVGVSTTLFYDPVERVIGKLHPNHTWEKVRFGPWWKETSDVNDTDGLDPKTDNVLRDFFTRLPDSDYLPTWYEQRSGGALGADEQSAAQKTEAHQGTPAAEHFDTLGRTFLTVAHNRKAVGGADEFLSARVTLDIQGNQREIRDAHVDASSPMGRSTMQYDYDIAGNRSHQLSMEAGEKWVLNDVTGKTIRIWDNPKQLGEPRRTFRTEYDALRRMVRSYVLGFDPKNPTREILYQRTVYGDSHPDSNATGGAPAALTLNLRGKPFLVADTAGILVSEGYDFKGNLLSSTRRFATNYKDAPDWKAVEMEFAAVVLNLTSLETALANTLETQNYTTTTFYDALNRFVSIHTPDQSTTIPQYNEANLLERLSVNLRGSAAATPFVANIDYNSKGQRELIEYGNGTKTEYTYDYETSRLTRLVTIRAAGLNGTAQALFADAATLQDLSFTYDPIGNITQIADAAIQRVVYNGQIVDGACEYTYDAIYRLLSATGREHITQSGFFFNPSDSNYRDHPFLGFRDLTNLQALRNYTEGYEYDDVGNFLSMTHTPMGGSSWTRTYLYKEGSLIEAGVRSNRLSGARFGSGPNPALENYAYDGHGNIVSMPHLSTMQWDFLDRLSGTSRQVTNPNSPGNTVPGSTYYVYDGTGQRVRKVNESQGGTRRNERRYLGGFEIYREYTAGGNVDLERQSLDVMDDKQRVALVETQTINAAKAVNNPVAAQRYQLGNHLGSVCLELDDRARLISYEEYTPYGNPSVQAGRSAAEVSLKRYRYTGKERDEETGFAYHGARYYACWLGRWASCDPVESENRYIYSLCRPTGLVDSSGALPAVGPYDEVRGDHIHQVASRTNQPGAERTSAPQYHEALAASTKSKRARAADERGQKVERAINQAAWGKDNSRRPAGRKGVGKVTLEAIGDTRTGVTKSATPSQWFEDTKSYYKELEKGASQKDALKNVVDSRKQLQEAGAVPQRVPDAPRNIPSDLRRGQNLSVEIERYLTSPRVEPPTVTNSKVGPVELHSGIGLGKADYAQVAFAMFERKQDEMVAEIQKKPYYSLSDEDREFMDYAGFEHNYNTSKWEQDPQFEKPIVRDAFIMVLTAKRTMRYTGDWLRSTLGIAGGTPLMLSAH